MQSQTNFPDYSGNACALLSSEERDRLWNAACTLVDERGLIVRITSFAGQGAEWAGAKASELGAQFFGNGWEEKVHDLVEDALWRGHDLATLGMDSVGEGEPWSWFNKIVTSATGAAGGFFGLPGMALDIPVSTLLIMRSIAEIARAHGEDITSDEGKRACLEVMAFGGPGVEDDDTEVGYWSTRAILAHTTIEIAIKSGRLSVRSCVVRKGSSPNCPGRRGVRWRRVKLRLHGLLSADGPSTFYNPRYRTQLWRERGGPRLP